jgi:hypothetical protein
VLGKVDHALGQAISSIETEQRQVASSGEKDPVLSTLKGWQGELGQMMARGGATQRSTAGADGPSAQEGGLYTD